jgi:hypothetical protein
MVRARSRTTRAPPWRPRRRSQPSARPPPSGRAGDASQGPEPPSPAPPPAPPWQRRRAPLLAPAMQAILQKLSN